MKITDHEFLSSLPINTASCEHCKSSLNLNSADILRLQNSHLPLRQFEPELMECFYQLQPHFSEFPQPSLGTQHYVRSNMVPSSEGR